jgi:hypothetical protein
MRDDMRDRRDNLRSTNAGFVAETRDKDLSSDIGFSVVCLIVGTYGN